MKVLLATDGSKAAEEAAAFLAHLPHPDRMELTVLAISPTFEFHGSREVVDWIQRNLETERQRAVDACQRVEAIFEGANASVETVITEGHAAKTIVAEAKARGSELIVLGALGHSTIDRILLGSVSDFVSTHAPCSVLLVRPGEVNHEGLKLCHAYDGSEQCQFARDQLKAFAWGAKVHLDLLSVMLTPYAYLEIPLDLDTGPIKEDMAQALQKVATQMQTQFPCVETHVIEAIHVGDAIVGFAKRQHSNLVVLGDTGRGLAGKFFLGSVSRYVLRHTHASVWIARKPD
ncbi:MAG: universal stress protein [Pirellulaceae bacterium]